MQYGNFRRQIVIERPVYAEGDYGEAVCSWETVDTVWAGVSYQSGGEDYEADQRVARRVTKFFIRYRADVDETMRITYDSGYYSILAIERIGRKKYLVIKADYADRGA